MLCAPFRQKLPWLNGSPILHISLLIACVCSGHIDFNVSGEFIEAALCRGDQLFPAICRHIVILIFLPSVYKHSQKLSHTSAHALAEHTHTHTAHDRSGPPLTPDYGPLMLLWGTQGLRVRVFAREQKKNASDFSHLYLKVYLIMPSLFVPA